MKPPDNNNIDSGFLCRKQDVLPMKFLDTLFQMSKREFRFSGGEDQGCPGSENCLISNYLRH